MTTKHCRKLKRKINKFTTTCDKVYCWSPKWCIMYGKEKGQIWCTVGRLCTKFCPFSFPQCIILRSTIYLIEITVYQGPWTSKIAGTNQMTNNTYATCDRNLWQSGGGGGGGQHEWQEGVSGSSMDTQKSTLFTYFFRSTWK